MLAPRLRKLGAVHTSIDAELQIIPPFDRLVADATGAIRDIDINLVVAPLGVAGDHRQVLLDGRASQT